MPIRVLLACVCVCAVGACHGPSDRQGAEATAAAAPASARYPVHRVAPGETLYSIAGKWATTPDTLQALNPGVDPRRLRVGQALRLPDPAQEPEGKPLLRDIRRVDDDPAAGRRP